MTTPRFPGTTYVLPVKWDDDADLAELTAYLGWLAQRTSVVVVDGSPEPLFGRHRRAWGGCAVHVAPDGPRFLNGKVTGVHTGVRRAETDRIVIADDDVRYDDVSLGQVLDHLEHADLVAPQNVFRPMPWHATWDTARSLLNRAVAGDYPGTFAMRRSTFLAMGGYDGDVLFENLELMRTVRASGGRVARPLDVYVTRRPPTTGRFLDQRVRQAYDDVAQPWRLALFLPLVPAALSGRRGRRVVAAALLGCIGLAEVGRRRSGGRRVFPAAAALLAPAWVAERAVCSWLAVAQLPLGGVRYGGRRLPVAAHDAWELRRRAAARGALVATGSPEAGAVRPVAERLERRAAAPAQGDGAPAGVDLRAVGA